MPCCTTAVGGEIGNRSMKTREKERQREVIYLGTHPEIGGRQGVFTTAHTHTLIQTGGEVVRRGIGKHRIKWSQRAWLPSSEPSKFIPYSHSLPHTSIPLYQGHSFFALIKTASNHTTARVFRDPTIQLRTTVLLASTTRVAQK